MIHVRRTTESDGEGGEMTKAIVITLDQHSSTENFKLMVRRALNTWDDAPQELKELGDMLDHGKILQDYSGNKSMAAVTSGDTGPDLYPGVEDSSLPICEYCGGRGEGHYHSCPALYKTVMPDPTPNKKYAEGIITAYAGESMTVQLDDTGVVVSVTPKD